MTHVVLNFFKSLNNRELAIAIWVLIATIWAISNSQIRGSLSRLVRAFFAWKLTLLYLVMAVYITIMVITLRVIGIWNADHLPITVLWCVFVAFVMLFDFTRANDSNFFKNTYRDNIKALILLEFIVNLYVFSLWVELFLVPVTAILSAMIAISETDEKYEITKKILTYAMSIIGLVFIVHAIYIISRDFNSFATLENLENFYLPILFSILFMPFVYMFALVSGYEMFFIRLSFFVENNSVLKYAKMKTVFTFKLNLWQLNEWSKYVVSTWRFKENQEVDDAILLFKKERASSIN